MFERRILRGLMLAMALALIVALLPTLALADKGNPPSGPGTDAVGHTTINRNPLTIHVAVDTSIKVLYAGQSAGQVYPPDYDEADSGAFAWFNALGGGIAVHGPDFLSHNWTAADFLNPWLTHGPQVKMGTGTAADPRWVGTTVEGPFRYTATVQQWVRYVHGDDCFTVSYLINHSEMGSADSFTIFHAVDLYVDGEDEGFGYYDAATGAVGTWNESRDFLEYVVPLTTAGGLPLPPASHYQEADYDIIWDNIGNGPASPGAGFNDTIQATPFHDSRCGLQSDLALPGVQPPGNFVELALDRCFLEVEQPEFVPEPGSVMLLAGGLMGLAGYAGLRIRKR
jgi:hypothetical protein